MNIGHLMRTFLAEHQPQDPKALELKVGQIVKGIVLQLLAEQEALVNINGAQLRAKLETPLRQGQSTLLQVQPESTGGQIVLKPLTQSEVQINQESLPEVMRSLGLKDTPKGRELINRIHQQGVALTKSNVRQLLPLLQSIPSGVPAEEWTQSAVVAFQRGLPMTDSTVGAVHRAIFGMPIHDQLAILEQEAAAWRDQGSMQQGRNAAGAGTASASVLADKLLSLLASIRGSTAHVTAGATSSPQQSNTALAQASAAAMNRTDMPAVTASPAATSAAGIAEASAGSTGSKLTEPPSLLQPKNDVASMPDRASSSSHLASSSPSALEKSTQAREVAHERAPAHSNKLPIAEDNPETAIRSASDHADRSSVRASGGEKDGGWVLKLLQQLGVDHEQQLFKQFVKGGFSLPGESAGASQLIGAASEQAESAVADSVKSVLLQLSGADELPPSLKEQVQNTLQQITGQQLLLQGDRGSTFTHLTMFLPMFQGTNGQTSAVHIQSRRSRKGEVDAENCRLLFDLHMKSIGDTMVDVQIMNKRVSLVVLNDHPAISHLFDMYRETLVEGLQSQGYQFLSMKCQPFPEAVPDSSTATRGPASTGAALDTSRSEIAARYRAKPYRGVDVRI
jgi:hypothetical protein